MSNQKTLYQRFVSLRKSNLPLFILLIILTAGLIIIAVSIISTIIFYLGYFTGAYEQRKFTVLMFELEKIKQKAIDNRDISKTLLIDITIKNITSSENPHERLRMLEK